MKIALVTDTHAGVRNDNPAFHEYQKRCWAWFFEYIDTHKIERVIHLGDIYDRRKYVNFMSAKRLREDFFEPLKERGVKVDILVGNHDMYYKDTHEVNALREIVDGRYSNVTIHDVPNVINVDGLDIQMMPWITDSNYDLAVEAIKTPKAPILMGHLELSGFMMHKGMVSDHGLDRKMFENFESVYSGHYHHRSSIGNIHYLGAFAEYTWSDYNDPRGFSVFETSTRQVEFIKNPNRIFKVSRYDDVAQPNIIEVIQNADFSKFADCYVKMIVVNKSNPYAFDLLFDSIYKVKPLDIQVIDDPTVLLEESEEDVDEADDTPTILSKYIDNLKLSLDPNKVKSFIMDVYNEALEVDSE